MKEAVEWIGNHLWTIVVGLSLIIQIAPIKINPWSALFKWIGKLLVGETCTKIDGIVKKINDIEEQVMTNEKDRIRYEVLDFANSCRNGRRHTRDEFQHIVELNKKYRKLLEATKDENGVFELEYDYVQNLYAECMEKNNFL